MKLTKYNEEELTAIEENAGLFFTPMEIASILEKDSDEFIIDFKSNIDGIKTKYDRGLLLSQATMRKSLIELANRGSNTAITDALRILTKLQKKLDNL